LCRYIGQCSPEALAALQMTDISDTTQREARAGVQFVRTSDRYIEQMRHGRPLR
jgi:4-hydroxyphenylpyruvate dioxygenase-like putative hemolysin